MKAYKENTRKYYKYGNISTLIPVGSPTVTDGIASGFSASNYFQTPQVFNPLGSELEIVFKINLTTLGVSSLLLSQGATTQFHRLALWVNNSNQFCLYVGNGSSWLFSILSNLTLEAGIDYWLKFVYSDGVYYLYYSLDGVYYQLDSSIESSVTIPNMTTTAFIGFLRDSATGTNYLRGSMDLSKSYIKIDGKDWLHFTKAEETTEQDYDFYKDVDTYKLPSKIDRKYYKYIDWTQPILTSNGTMGGNSFACSQLSVLGSGDAVYTCFNGTERWHSAVGLPDWVSFYNPNPLIVTNLAITNGNQSLWKAIKGGTIQGSNNGSDWVDITAFSNSNTTANATWNIDLSDNTNAYKYYRIYITSSHYNNNGYYCVIGKIGITAKEVVYGTSSDYDTYKDKITYYGIGE